MRGVAGGRTAQGTVVARDIDSDIAVIDTDTSGASVLPWGEGTAASIGMPVFALSNPGGRGLRVTFGFVSGVDPRSAAPAAAASPAAWSTPRRCCPARRAARS